MLVIPGVKHLILFDSWVGRGYHASMPHAVSEMEVKARVREVLRVRDDLDEPARVETESLVDKMCEAIMLGGKLIVCVTKSGAIRYIVLS